MKPIRRPGQLLVDDDEHTIEPTEAPTVVTKHPAQAEDPTLAPKTQAPRSSNASLKALATEEEGTLTVKMESPLKVPVAAKLEAQSEDPTVTVQVQAPPANAMPEEPTVSAQVDVRAAFDSQGVSFPRGAAVLEPIEEAPPPQERTLPLVSPAQVLEARRASAPRLDALPPPSDPILVAPAPAEDDEPDIPGVSGAPRRRMRSVVFGVLGLCGLLCVGAVAKQLIGGTSASTSPTTTATASAPATATASAPATATASATATATASATASASAPASARAPVASAPPAPAPPPAPVAPARRSEPQARTATPRPAATAAAPKPTGRSSIVRDTPF